MGMLLMGVALALPQWWLLRQQVRHACLWILAYGLSWSILGLLNQVTAEPFSVGLIVALTPTLLTGIALWLLLDWLPRREGIDKTLPAELS